MDVTELTGIWNHQDHLVGERMHRSQSKQYWRWGWTGKARIRMAPRYSVFSTFTVRFPLEKLAAMPTARLVDVQLVDGRAVCWCCGCNIFILVASVWTQSGRLQRKSCWAPGRRRRCRRYSWTIQHANTVARTCLRQCTSFITHVAIIKHRHKPCPDSIAIVAFLCDSGTGYKCHDLLTYLLT